MTDIELLEMAAKTAGIVGYFDSSDQDDRDEYWNPLTDDGDAFRLAVKLDLFMSPRFSHERDVLMFTKNMPRIEATRRACVIYAAEFCKAMVKSK